MSRGCGIAAIEARLLRVPLHEPFAIAGGSSAELETVFVRLRLEDGTIGHGEASPLPAFNGESAAGSLTQTRNCARRWLGRDGTAWRSRLEELEHWLPRGGGAARAGLGMALLDAWTRRARLPLRSLFGGCESRVVSDVTVTLGDREHAFAAGLRIRRLGVRAVKIKVGLTPADDAARVLEVRRAHPAATLLLDANQGYDVSSSLALVRRLRVHGVAPALFEQPAPAGDIDGLLAFHRRSGVPVAADESLAGRADALTLARRGAAQVLNLKLMKMGLLEAWDCARIARAAGLELMVGGMVETPLAMGAAAHLAAGLGGVRFVDLDTPLWLAKSLTRGVGFGRGGVYELSAVRAGIGVIPTGKIH